MPEILIVTSRPGDWAEFAAVLSEGDWAEIGWAESETQAVAAVKARAPLAAILDEELGGAEPLALAARLLEVNAFVSSAVVSRLDEGEFHETSEGLGLLGKLDPGLKPEEAASLRTQLQRLPVMG